MNTNENANDESHNNNQLEIIEKKEEIGMNTSAIDPEELKKLVENNPELQEEMKESSILHNKNLNVENDIEENEKKKAELLKKQEEEKSQNQKKKRLERIHEMDEKE